MEVKNEMKGTMARKRREWKGIKVRGGYIIKIAGQMWGRIIMEEKGKMRREGKVVKI